ncbi:MAG: hypothetical protein ACRDO8_09620 [Nocardioidaceae bacterium]
MNTFAIVSIVVALLAVAATVATGMAVLAVFSVGAGHLALQQIRGREERGTAIAYAALAISYLIGLYAIGSTLYYAVAVL